MIHNNQDEAKDLNTQALQAVLLRCDHIFRSKLIIDWAKKQTKGPVYSQVSSIDYLIAVSSLNLT